jgi:hypothetical protein
LQKIESVFAGGYKIFDKCGLMMASKKKIQHGNLLGYLRHLVYRDCVFSQKFAHRLNIFEVLDTCQKLLENFGF